MRFIADLVVDFGPPCILKLWWWRRWRESWYSVLTIWRSRSAGTRWSGRNKLVRPGPSTAPPCAQRTPATSTDCCKNFTQFFGL